MHKNAVGTRTSVGTSPPLSIEHTASSVDEDTTAAIDGVTESKVSKAGIEPGKIGKK